MNYRANDIVSALSHAQSLSRHSGGPISIIDRNGRPHAVKTVVEGDKVIINGVMAPRKTSTMIETGCEAEQEISRALRYVQRAAAIIKQKHGTDIEAEEIIADLMMTTEVWAAMDKNREEQIAKNRKPSFFTRIFGRAFVRAG